MSGSKSNRKRQSVMEDHDHKCKEKETEIPMNPAVPLDSVIAAGSVSRTKLSNVNQDCLKNIFKYLELEDLLNVANANKYIKPATEQPFVEKYSKRFIQIVRYKRSGPIEEFNSIVCVQRYKQILQLLRCFGHLITKLDYCYNATSVSTYCAPLPSYQRILSYINEYCAESLTNFHVYPAYAFEKFTKPFPKVEQLLIEHSLLETSCLGELFSNVRHLTMKGQGSLCTAAKFPKLFYLELCNGYGNEYEEMATKMLTLNQHLRSLKVNFHQIEFLQSVQEKLQSIECLNIDIRCANSYELRHISIHFSNVTKLNIEFVYNRSTRDMPKIPFTFGQLKELTLQGQGVRPSDAFGEFINKNKSIEKVETKFFTPDGFLDPSKLNRALPALKEVVLDKYTLSAYSGIHLLDNLKLIKSIKCVRINHKISQSVLRDLCDNEWKAIYIEPYTKLERRV